ncbi:FAD-dependent oxidoreductase [Kitasatospora sp. NPDC056327]|uniref:FAD-dependent oxidoreductase n=1 Tax=Kitasatospora sp. NPDC056327 TaxID=3345785 RepID=UPI0035D86BBD
MAYAITRTCCNDASCVSVCPVNCIHPTPDEPEFGRTDLLYVDPAACIDCGACADACPVDAVVPVDALVPADRPAGPGAVHAGLGRDWYRDHPTDHAWGAPVFPRSLSVGLDPGGRPGRAARRRPAPPRVAVVGTGPSAGYTAQALLRSTGAEITMIDRLPVTGGLLRHGVAPDHGSTRRIAEGFAAVLRDPRVRLHLNVEVGTDLLHAELAAHHHAVVYAVGAAADRRLGVPGEDLPGSLPAVRLVHWYNAEPTVPAGAVALDAGTGAGAERAVVVGNGNVAVDIARILLTGPDALAGTDIADHALAALRRSRVREVVLLARRGPGQAAWTAPEFLALTRLPGVEVVVDDHPEVRAALAGAAGGSHEALLAGLPLVRVDGTAPPRPGRRIVLRFHAAPAELLGGGRVEAVRLADGGLLHAGLVVRSIGTRGVPLPGLPFDEAAGAVPRSGARVLDPATGRPLPGTYLVGWAKRGPSGGIGANRVCAEETVHALLDDAEAGVLPVPAGGRRAFDRLVRARRPDALGLRQLRAIDRAERARGEAAGRPRVRLSTVPALLAAARR